MRVPVICVSGSPHDLGFQHGSQARKAIEDNVSFYMNVWKHLGGSERDRILKEVPAFVPYIEKHDPELVEELNALLAESSATEEQTDYDNQPPFSIPAGRS